MENNYIENTDFSAISGFKQEPNNIVFSLDGEDMIRMNKNGFYIKGKLVKKDKEIYLAFKEWIEKANNQI